MSSSPHNRASLLAGLRTGGVRHASATHPRFLPNHNLYSDEDEQLPVARQQAQLGLNPNSVPFSPTSFSNQNPIPQNQLQNQAFQMQLLQLEMMRIQSQALQAQQLQAELLAQAQRQQQAQVQAQAQAHARERRSSLNFNAPATAGPQITAFDLRSATRSAQMRRANQAEQLRAQLGLNPPVEDQVPMTAALGGRFGGRLASGPSYLPRCIVEELEEYAGQMPATPGSTTVISGGTSLGSPASSNVTPTAPPSRSDQVSNWRRGGNNSSLNGNYRAVSSPAVKITPPPADHQRISPPPGITVTGPIAKGRPQPLNIFPATSQPFTTMAIDATDSAEDDAEIASSSASSASVRSSNISSPTTPRSSSSYEPQLSPREEATKKLYEGLGIGRPFPTVSNTTDQSQQYYTSSYAHSQPAQAVHHRLVSQPTRQPHGPPSGADELGPKNFATRIRRQAIGGLGVLMGARERRESFVEAY